MAKILVVEDGIYLRDLYKQILELEGYSVEVAVDGLEALKMLLHGGYDLVLLDIKLPKMDGLTVLEKLHEQAPEQANGPIFFLTCDDAETSRLRGMKLGATKYLIKSNITPGQLVQEVKKTLEGVDTN